MGARELRFGAFRLDTANACVWRGPKAVHLAPKAFAVLLCLAERPGQLVTKEALLDAVWTDTVVGEAVLKVCVREIRKALGDRAGAPRFVATVHRQGYRFIADVADAADPPASAAEGPRRAPTEASLARLSRPRGPTRLAGRQAPLDRLQTCLDAAWRGNRQMVFVTGEPGMGKTALVDAFLERAAADPRVSITQGVCVEAHGVGEPYLPVLDALARLCRENDTDSLVSLLRREAPTWLAQMPWLLSPADRDALERDLIGATRERMLREMAELLEALTRETPLILVLEDLHWSDAATLDLLSLVASRPTPARLLFIGTCRPLGATAASVSDLARELRARGRGQELALALLPEGAVAEYLSERFPGGAFPSDLARVVHRRTEGNALFMVTMVEDLLARGLIAAHDRGWELSGGLAEVELGVPESLRQMIERQIGQIAPDEQRMLEAGSAAGMEFSAASVAAAVEQKLAEVEERFDELARRHLFIRSLGLREWPDRTVATRYAFVHAFHRNTLYQRLSPGRRRELHRAIAEREEAGHGDRVRDIAAGLAAHFEQTGDDERAVRYLRQAAETAVRRHANREAIGFLSRARDIANALPDADRVPTRLALLEQLGLARRSMGDVPGAVEDFESLAAAARAHGRIREEVRALLYLGSALSWIDRDRGLAAVEQAVERAEGLDDAVLEAHVRGYCGVQRILSRGWRDEDAEACRAAIDVARAAQDRTILSLHVGHYAYLQSHRAEYRAAARTAEEGLRLALDASDAYHYMTCQFHRGWALLHLGEWGETRRILRDGLEMAERNGHHLWARAFRFQTAWLLVHAGDFEGARALCRHELEPAREAQLGELLGFIVLGFAHLGLEQYGPALHAFEGVASRVSHRPVLLDWILQMPLRLGLAEYWLARRAPDRAREQAKLLCGLAATAGEQTYLALGRRVLAEVSLAGRDDDGAERDVSAALRALSGRELPLAEWRVRATAARCEEARGRGASAAAHWARSREVLDRLADSLAADADLRRTFAAQPEARAVHRHGASQRRARPRG